MRFLVVDDDGVCRKKLECFMKEFGECETVASGAEAVVAFKKAWDDWRPFNLIMMDVLMPGTNGTETLFEIRRLEKDKKVPVEDRVKIIMTTGRSDKDTVVKAIKAGCDGYLIKPFTEAKVREELEKLGGM
jgi:two-component system, chemotaxis family, chemotaxis protein CheY